MYYSVMVVEDEALQRTLFLQSVDWEAYQCRVVCDCASVEEAIAYTGQNGFPDILFTDIRLLQRSGIELCQYMQQQSPRTRKMILSGYSDFDYAKQAIEYGVKEYLLKPAQPHEVEAVLARYTNELLMLRHNEQELERIHQMVQKNRRHYVENLLAELAGGTTLPGDEDLLSIARELDFTLERYYYLVIKHRAAPGQAEQLSLSLQLRAFLREQFAFYGECYLFDQDYHRICCVLIPRDAEQDPEKILKATFAMIPLFSQGLTVSAGLSLPQTGLRTIRKAHEQAMIACDHDFYFGPGSIIPFQPIFNRQIDTGLLPGSLADGRILSQLMVGNWEDALALLKALFADIRQEQQVNTAALQGAAVELVTAIYQKIYTLNPDYEAPDASEVVLEVAKAATLPELEQTLARVLQTCGETVQRHFLHHTHEAVSMILAYLNRHYQRQITLDELSKLVYLNPKYICAILKKDTGKTFHEILTEIRVMNARALLRDPAVKMYQVSQNTGFYDSKAFSAAFKRVTEMTPTQYRRQVLAPLDAGA